MKKNYYYSFLLLLFISATVCGQANDKMKADAPFQKTLRFSQGLPFDAAISALTKEYKLGKGNTFEAKTTSVNKVGMSHQKLQQFYNGIKVEYGVIIAHSKDGLVESINGEVYNVGNASTEPTLSKEKALAFATEAQPSSKYLWEDAISSREMDYKKPEGELVFFPMVYTGEVKLAYKFDIYSITPLFRNYVYVDATTGKVLFSDAIIKHADGHVDGGISAKKAKQITKALEMLVTASNVPTRYSGARNIETTLSGSNFILNDVTRGNGIVTYNSAQTTTTPSTDFTDVDNTWSTGNYDAASSTKDNAALDAHWGAEMTYDFWKTIFNRSSIDDAGFKLKSYVHYDDNTTDGVGYDNAFWNGQAMIYGDGSSFSILTALDVCGHEIGHGVCQQTAGLAYQNQSGAMNEGLSDIWGACVENFGRNGQASTTLDVMPAANSSIWLIGEDITAGKGLRSMSNPRSTTVVSRCPKTFRGSGYMRTVDDGGTCVPDATTNDHCGVHGNSGVLNHWFFILTTGEAGTNDALPASDRDTYNVTGIGMRKAAEITFLVERDYLTPNATFMDFRNASLAVAESIYCISSPEYKAVGDAWNAVNVGAAILQAPDDVKLKTITASSSVACGAASSATVVFQNAGTNPITSVDISYNIDGGTNTTETWTGNLAVCTSQNYPLTIPAVSRGTHTLNVTTTTVNDGVATNNTLTSSVIGNDSGIVNTINTFDSTTDALVTIDNTGLNTVWERGTSTKTNLTDAVAGGSPVYATKLAGTYPDKTISYLVSQCYDLSNTSSPDVKFDMAYDLESSWDILYMEYSTDGATWNTLGTGASATWYTSSRLPDGTDCFNCIGGQWTGEAAEANPRGDGINAKMRSYSYDLSAFGLGGATPASNILFRFVFRSDDSVNKDGVIIDNFVIEGTLGTAHNNFNTFSVSPNPSKGTVTLTLSANSNVKVSLFDISGRSIYNKTYSNTDTMFNQELKFNNLSKGVYLLNVESDGKKASKKLIIE